MVFTRNFPKYNHYTFFNESLTNLTFKIKLWNPDDAYKAEARLLLSLFPLPLTPEEINDMKFGIEIFISNQKSALRIGNKDKIIEYESSFNVIKSYRFTTFSLSWDNGLVSLYIEDENEPIFLAEYNYDKGLFGVYKNSFLYYSLQGTNVLWALPLCDEDNECETHITTGGNFERFFPLHQTELGYDINFYLRAMHSAFILFQISPGIEYPKMILKLSHFEDNKTKLIFKEFEDSPEILAFIGKR